MRIPFSILTCVLFLFSCNKDKEPPTIYITAPTVNKTYSINDTIRYNLTFVDNLDLAEYNISIDHAEEFVMTNPFSNILPPFTASASGTLNSNTEFVSGEFIIDQSAAAGQYSMDITATDNEGNPSFKNVLFRIRNQFDTIAPVIDSIIVPETNTAVPVTFSTTIHDDQQLATLQYFIVRQSPIDTVLYRYFPLSDTIQTFTDTFSVPNGSYRLKLRARDAVNNQVEREKNFIIQ